MKKVILMLMLINTFAHADSDHKFKVGQCVTTVRSPQKCREATSGCMLVHTLDFKILGLSQQGKETYFVGTGNCTKLTNPSCNRWIATVQPPDDGYDKYEVHAVNCSDVGL